MKRLLAAALFVLGMAHATLAQDRVQISEESNRNVAADFAQTSAASTPMVLVGTGPRSSATSASGDFAGLSSSTALAAPASFAAPFTATSFVPLAAPARSLPFAEASSASPETYAAEGLEYRMELCVGAALVRFRSSVYSATAPGLSTSFAYFLKEKIAIEGSVIGAFAPVIFANEHVKYLGYGAGPKLILQQARLSPWVHAIVGGAHVVPKTALGGKNGFLLQVGGGVDYQLVPRVAVRAEVDWVRTQLFGESQNSGQAIVGLVLHF
jgi:hypothetical protein